MEWHTDSMHQISGSNPAVMHVFSNMVCTFLYIPGYTLLECHVIVYSSIYWFVVVCTCLSLDKCVIYQYTAINDVYTIIY